MGELITLALGNFEVDWGKNHVVVDHSPLFQANNFGTAEYRYVDEDGSPIIERKEALCKPLREVLPRIELLGHDLKSARAEYEGLHHVFDPTIGFEEFVETAKRVHPESLNDARTTYEDLRKLHGHWEFSFDELLEVMKLVDVNALTEALSDDHSFGEFFTEEIIPRTELAKKLSRFGPHARSKFGEMMENFHPWSVLRLFAENSANLDIPVSWHYADVLEGGWAEREAFVPSVPKENRFLLVTEGSSDAKILKKGFELLKPHISDFFYFVDMEEGYPFTGTGNLGNFCKGLASIDILNKVLIIFDNDAEGVSKSQQVQPVTRLPNMNVMVLPDLDELRHFLTIGPSGESRQDINGRAVSIETYLDLAWHCEAEPVVRWSAYVPQIERYQGALVNKDKYAREFLSLRTRPSDYDVSKLAVVLNEIERLCVGLKAS